MDGTLLNDDLIITEHTKAAIISAVESGAYFVVSTGRSMMSAARKLTGLEALFDRDMPFITFNGATVVMGKSKKILFNLSLGKDYAKQIYDIGLKRGIPVIMWIGEQLWVSHDCEAVREYQKLSNAEVNIIEDIERRSETGVSKMMWIDSPEKILSYQDEMNKYFNGSVNCHLSKPEFLEFVSEKASKGAALREIGKVLGIDKSEIIAVGDSYNDLSMLEYAGLGVAMQNASGDIKSLCQYVTLSNNHDGVAEVIEKFVL